MGNWTIKGVGKKNTDNYQFDLASATQTQGRKTVMLDHYLRELAAKLSNVHLIELNVLKCFHFTHL